MENSELLKMLIKNQINKSFVELYRDQATDEQGLGLLISKYFKWDGLAILKTLYTALEDANFHTENKEIEKLIKRVESDYEVA